jgi:superfamily II RNA helicase
MRSSALKLLGGCAVIAMLALMAIQRAGISGTRAANEALRQQSAEAAPSATTQSKASNDEIDALQEANRELPKLRNEVRQLRDEKREFERLQAENERLAAALKVAPKTTARPMSEAEGFVLRQQWMHAGFATPEATLQTFFWAIANKDFAALAECATGDARKSMEEEIQRSVADGGKRFDEQFEPLAQMQGFRIAEKKQISENKIELGIQAAAGGRVMPMRLQLVNGEWKLGD